MRRGLDLLYLAGGVAAAAAISLICLVVTAQVCLNILARIGGPGYSFTIPSYADFAGFLLAAASFLALAPTLRAGVHIRVNLLTSRLGPRASWALELLVLVMASALAGYACFYAINLTWESWDFGDMSTGMVAIPLWIPQLAMDAGLALLTIALLDTLVESLRAGHAIIADAGEA
jgi:TRAP-type C4-dicarboxylate transport system permease small subunit|tara:strand:- start:249 stop:773 length:525 start_codon:yes stop_codon:yes gene_type:complete